MHAHTCIHMRMSACSLMCMERDSCTWCVAMCVCVYFHTNIHANIHTYIHTCIHTHIHTYVHVYTGAWVRVVWCAWSAILARGVQLCVWCASLVYIHTYIHTFIHTYIHAYIHIYMHLYIHVYILWFVFIRRHTYIHVHGRVAGMHSWMCLCIHARDHMYTRAIVNRHATAHTPTHTAPYRHTGAWLVYIHTLLCVYVTCCIDRYQMSIRRAWLMHCIYVTCFMHR